MDDVKDKCPKAWATRVGGEETCSLTTPAGDAAAGDDDDADAAKIIVFAAVLFAIVCAILVFS
jgi:hypothetical protein